VDKGEEGAKATRSFMLKRKLHGFLVGGGNLAYNATIVVPSIRSA
jgi:hypothetical protein